MATVKVDPFEGRQDSERNWVLPRSNLLHNGVFPLVVGVKSDRVPVGTAFCISRLGLIATARHCLEEALRLETGGRRLSSPSGDLAKTSLTKTSLSVLWQAFSGDQANMMLWPLETAEVPLPTDLGFAGTQFQETHPYLSLPLSFALPRVGEEVRCIGCIDLDRSNPVFSDDHFKSGMLFHHFEPRLRVVEARVTHVFIRRFARGFVDGPCFLVDADLPHGMSGGPVLDNRGFVRGVVTAGAATITGEPSSIVSLLYPAFNTELRFGAQIGPMRIDATRPLFELVGDGFIKTDGSETMVTLQPDSDDLLVGIMSPRAESDHVFDDFPGLQKGLPPTKAAGTHYRLKYHTED